MIKIKKEGVILNPTKKAFEDRSVLNPAIYQEGENVHLIYRAINKEYISCLGYAKLSGPLEVKERWNEPFMSPQKKEECKGIEDPRIVKIDDTFYLTYVVHDGKNAVTAYSYGKDILTLKRGGVISPKIKYRDAVKLFSYSKLKDDYYFFESFYQKFGGSNILIWHKDVFLFPEKVNDKFIMLHRILPEIQILEFEDFKELQDRYCWIYHLINLEKEVLMEPQQGFESRHIGGGGPPIKTPDGWIFLFHGAQEFNKKRVYSAGAALLDLDDPHKVIARLPYPLFVPDQEYELKGTVNDVVFPTGTAVFQDTLYIYYGAADKRIAVASVNIKDLIEELKKFPVSL